MGRLFQVSASKMGRSAIIIRYNLLSVPEDLSNMGGTGLDNPLLTQGLL